jgi:hypothetical protein
MDINEHEKLSTYTHIKIKQQLFYSSPKECVKNPTIDIDHTVGKRVDCVVSFFSSTTIFVNSENNAMKRKS